MARLLLVIALAGCGRIGFDLTADAASPDAPPPDAPLPAWGLVQTAKTTSSRTLPLAQPLGERDLVIVAVSRVQGAVDGLTDDSTGCNNVYQPIADAGSSDGSKAVLRLFYAKSMCQGARTINIVTGDDIVAAVAWEVSGIRTDDPLDTARGLSDQLATTTPSGPEIRTSTDSEFVVSVAIVEFDITGIADEDDFIDDYLLNNDGWAHLRDRTAKAGAYQAHWNQSEAGTYCASAAAFKVGP